jgi:uncharacterized protein (DUF2062 family)
MKRWLKRITPDRDRLRDHKHLRLFGTLLHDPNLWHLNRRSASGAFAVGLFMMFFPLPGQMVLAAAVAMLIRVNLPISVALVWISNPLTIPPMFYFAYLVGTWTLGQPALPLRQDISVEWLMESLECIWAPLLIGSLLCGLACSLTGYFAIRGLWRWHLIRQIRLRRERYRAASRLNAPSSKRQT